MKRLDGPVRKQMQATIDKIVAGDPTTLAQTHPLIGPMKGWMATKGSRGHRVIHRPNEDGGIHIGYVGLHEYDKAIQRLTSRTAGLGEDDAADRDEVYAAERALPPLTRQVSITDARAKDLASKHLGRPVDLIRTDRMGTDSLQARWFDSPSQGRTPLLIAPSEYPLSHHEVCHETAHLLADRNGPTGHGAAFREHYLRILPQDVREHMQRHLGGSQKTAGANGEIPEGTTYEVANTKDFIRARHPNGNSIGYLQWEGPGAPWSGVIHNAWVDDDHRRKGLATELLRRAREVQPDVHHSTNLSDDAKGWAGKVAGAV